jgi:hypothetical protein
MAEAVIMELRSRSVIRWDRCRRTTRLGCAKEWNATFRAGRIVCFLCPGRQTPEENAEAIMNEATTDYIGLDERGRFIGRPKPVISNG